MEEYAKRIANSLEKMVELSIEADNVTEPPPPKCPHCNTINPTIAVQEGGGQGSVNTFIIRGDCTKCGRTLYAVSELWILHPKLESAEMHIAAIKKRMAEN